MTDMQIILYKVSGVLFCLALIVLLVTVILGLIK